MAKYIVRYLVFWAPALLIARFFDNPSVASQIAQLFLAFFMILGWSINTGMFAYHRPRQALSVILMYAGVHGIVIFLLYSALFGSLQYTILRNYGGIFSFLPLQVLVRALLDFNIQQEVYVIGFLLLCCMVGYGVGLLQRRIHPNPYSPRILR